MIATFTIFLLFFTSLFCLSPKSIASSSTTVNAVELDNKNTPDSSEDSDFITLSDQLEISKEPILDISLEDKEDYCVWLNEHDPDFFYDIATAEELKKAGVDEEDGFRLVRFKKTAETEANLERTDSQKNQKSLDAPAIKNKAESKSWWPSWFSKNNASNSSPAGVGGAMIGGGIPTIGGAGTVTRATSLGATVLEDVELVGEIAVGAGTIASFFIPGLGEAAIATEMAPEIVAMEPVVEGFFTRIGGWMGRTATRLLGRKASAVTRTATREATQSGAITVERSVGQRIATTSENNLPVAQLQNTVRQESMIVEAKAEDTELQREVEWLDRMHEKNQAETARKAASGELYRENIENGNKILSEMTPDHPHYEFFKDLL